MKSPVFTLTLLFYCVAVVAQGTYLQVTPSFPVEQEPEASKEETVWIDPSVDLITNPIFEDILPDEREYLQLQRGLGLSVVNDLQLQELELAINMQTGTYDLLFEQAAADAVKIRVFSSTGRLVYAYDNADATQQFKETTNIPVYLEGYYFLEITNGYNYLNKKIVVKKSY